MSLGLEKRLSLMAEASNLMLAGSARTYSQTSRVNMRRSKASRKAARTRAMRVPQ